MKRNQNHTIEWLNSLPVNQKALEMLNRSGEKTDPLSLYSVQLVRWALNKGALEAEDSVLETVDAMSTWRPARLMNFLLISEEGDYNPVDWEKPDDPLDFALIILSDIEEKMMIHFPWYGSL